MFTEIRRTIRLNEVDLPREDVLGVVVSQADFRGSAKGPSLSDAVIRLNEVGHWEAINYMSPWSESHI